MVTETVLAVVIAVVYLSAAVWWGINYASRIEPYLLRRLGKHLGVKIVRAGRNWRIVSEHTWQQGCLTVIVELLAAMFFFSMPFWVLIGLIGVFLILSSGNG